MALTSKLEAIGDAIREKTGGTDKLNLDDMPTQIKSIEGGGESGGISQEDFNTYLGISTPAPSNRGEICYKMLKNWASEVTYVNEHALYKVPCFYKDSDEVWHYLQFPKVKTIDEYGLYRIFSEVTSLIDMVFPELTQIKSFGFYWNVGVKSISAPKLTTLNDYAVGNCLFLTSVDMPELTAMGNSCFSGDKSIKEVFFPKLETLQHAEFEYCLKLEKVDLPALTSLKATFRFYTPFRNCTALTALILRNETLITLSSPMGLIEDITDKDFPLSPAYTGSTPGYIYVPKALVEDYKVATNWSVFADKFRAIEDYPDICGTTEETASEETTE